MAVTTRTFLAGFANVLAVFLVVGVISNEYFKESEAPSMRSAESVAQPLPLTGVMQPRKLAKGGKMGAECVDPDATSAPTKGKGSKGGKMDSSAAPSFFCSEAPSVAPSLSAGPSVMPSAGPSATPSLSLAPSTAKGKGMMSTKGGKMA